MADLTEGDFARVDLRVATILKADRVAATDRLVRLRIRMGAEERQIVAGIGGSYEPGDLPGRQIVVVANLQPAVIRGVRSHGMLLATESDGRLMLIGPEREIPDGAKVE